MKILVLTGSPHKKGTTALLADEYCQAAEEAGHNVHRFNTAFMQIQPCTGCDHCRKSEDSDCIFRDDMQSILPHLLDADAVVLVSPLYYFAFTSQLKNVIDRFYEVNDKLQKNPKQLQMIVAGADTDEWAMDGVKAHYQCLCRYLNWEDRGMVLAYGCGTREEAKQSKYVKDVTKLVQNL